MALIEELPGGFKFKTTPWKQQAVCFLATVLEEFDRTETIRGNEVTRSHRGFLSALDLGTGKTKVAIDVCRYLNLIKGGGFRALVVCLDSATYNWKNEVATHSNMTAEVLDGTIPERWERVKESDANFLITNFEGFRYMFAEKKKDDKGKSKFATSAKKISILWDRSSDTPNIDYFIIDESHIIKNHLSLTFRIARAISKIVYNRLLLTGTPFGNTPLDIWTQYYCVDYGETFYRTITAFRTKYFVDKGFFGPDWRVTKKGKKEIEAKLWSRAIRYREDEVDNLPPKVYRQIEYKLKGDQRQGYIDFYDYVAEQKKRKITVNSHIAFKQICSGFLGKDGETVYKNNGKLDALGDLLDSMIDSAKVVIFYYYVQEGIILEKYLKKKKIKYVSLKGGLKAADKWKAQERFKDDDKVRAAVVQIKVGGASINLIAATYCVFMSNHGSVIDRKQAEKRIHRGGQTKRCFYYDFVGRGTVEKRVNKDLMKGIETFREIIDPDQIMDIVIDKKEI